jgi:Domain of unknown function (DUF3303)
VLGWRAETTPLEAPLSGEGVDMKYVLTWELRPNYSEDQDERSLEVFGRWSPAEGANFLEFVARVDGRGGFAVVETEDVTLIARDVAIFTAFFDFNVYPVIDVRESAQIAGDAVEFRRSTG